MILRRESSLRFYPSFPSFFIGFHGINFVWDFTVVHFFLQKSAFLSLQQVLQSTTQPYLIVFASSVRYLWCGSGARERPFAGRRCFPGVGVAAWCFAGWGPLPSFFLLQSSPLSHTASWRGTGATPLPGFLPPCLLRASPADALRPAACASPARTRRRAGLSCGGAAARQRAASPWWTRQLDGLSSSGDVERTLKRSGEGAEARSRRSK
jgi:hypothetical protein